MNGGRLCLRRVRQARWLDTPLWLPSGEATGDCLTDLITSNNRLSLYVLPPDAGDDLIQRVAIAVAATRERSDTLDYALFQEVVLGRIGIESQANPGETPDDLVNSLHVDLIKLTATHLRELAIAIRQDADMKRLTKHRVRERLAAALQASQIERARLKATLLQEIT